MMDRQLFRFNINVNYILQHLLCMLIWMLLASRRSSHFSGRPTRHSVNGTAVDSLLTELNTTVLSSI